VNPLPPDARRALEPTDAEVQAQLAPLSAEELHLAAMATAPSDGELRVLRVRLPREAGRQPQPGRALVLAVAAILLVWWLLPGPQVAPTPVADAEVVAGDAASWPVGEQRALTGALALSTSIGIEPSPAATLRLVHQDTNGARLELVDGAATFEVDPNGSGRDLRVMAGQVEVRVIGTRFTVRRAGDTVAVDVARGRVEVHHKGGVSALGAGEALTLPDSGVLPLSDGNNELGTAPPSPTAAQKPDAPPASPDPSAEQARSWAALLDRLAEAPPAAALAEVDAWLAFAGPGPLTDEAEVHRLLLLAEAEPPRRALTDVERWLAVSRTSPSFPRIHLLRAELLVLDQRCDEAAASVAVVRALGSDGLQERAAAVADSCAP
jgi:ferric-dicitrate binding protein FerR (iron transport regulator)